MNLAFGNPSSTARVVTFQVAPLAVPLRFEVAEAAAVEPVATACRAWEGPAGPGPALRVRIELSAALSGTGRATMAVDGGLVQVRGPGVAARADLDHGCAHCAVSVEYLDDPPALFREAIEPLVLMLMSRRDRTPLHASGFLVDGLAILLAGRSGAGKSCLARAADTAGLQVLSDDAVFVQLEPRLTVWGWPGAAHLLGQDAPDPTAPTRIRGGRRKHVVPLRSASVGAVRCHRAVLCLLARSDGERPELEPISATAARQRLWPLDDGFDLLPGPIARVVARLAAAGAWELRLTADPAQAVGLLAARVAQLSGTAAQ
jgi:hypothetical protein